MERVVNLLERVRKNEERVVNILERVRKNEGSLVNLPQHSEKLVDERIKNHQRDSVCTRN